jgi:hypothetical protein
MIVINRLRKKAEKCHSYESQNQTLRNKLNKGDDIIPQ